jgi:Sulfotransferase domain
VAQWPRGVPAPVPATPAGWTTAPPDFVGVGAQKSGTTWWYSLIAAHPKVFEPPRRRKELHYFDRFWDEPFGAAEARGYHDYFPRPAGGSAGEWTPRYMVDFWTPALLAESAPDTKILVILRDPYDRFLSGVTHDLQRRSPHHPIVTELGVRKSTYRQQLRRMLNHFDRDALLVLQYERCRLDPRGELRRTLEFLGLDDFEPPAGLLQYGANVTKGSRYEPEARVRDAFIDTLSGDLGRLLADFPEIDPALWPSCKEL